MSLSVLVRAMLVVAATTLASAQQADSARFLSQPLVSDIYTADPSAHVFDGKIYIYPSHDIEAGVPDDDHGSHFAMRDYHVLSMDAIGGRSPITASRSTSRTCRGPAARCGRRTPRRRMASTTCTSRSRTSRTSSGSASLSATILPGRSPPSPSRSPAASASIPACSRTRRPVLHVLRRHLGRAAAALGDRHLQRRRTSIRPTTSRRSARRSRASATTC